jgi:aspartyl-tRNA(Asn)/glutamyl-tRNA(Gln) amidotransferase subunit A
MSLTLQTASEQLRGLNAGAFTSVELTRAYLDRIETVEDRVSAFLRVDAASALERAAQIDSARSKRHPLGRLAGLPVAIKDILCERGALTTCASRML